MGNAQPFLPGPGTWCGGCRGSAWGCAQEEDGEEGRQAGREALCACSPLPAWLSAVVPCAVFAPRPSGSRWLDVLILSPSPFSAF